MEIIRQTVDLTTYDVFEGVDQEGMAEQSHRMLIGGNDGAHGDLVIIFAYEIHFIYGQLSIDPLHWRFFGIRDDLVFLQIIDGDLFPFRNGIVLMQTEHQRL